MSNMSYVDALKELNPDADNEDIAEVLRSSAIPAMVTVIDMFISFREGVECDEELTTPQVGFITSAVEKGCKADPDIAVKICNLLEEALTVDMNDCLEWLTVISDQKLHNN
jgi:hypothetical protein